MEKKHKLKFNIEKIRKWLGVAVVVALFIMETVICAQSASTYEQLWEYIMLLACCLLLDVSVALKYYVIKSLNIKFAAYGADFFFLLVISIITGNDFCVVLYCLSTTEFYLSNEKIRTNLIIFGVSAAVFVASFVFGWVRVHTGASVYNSIVQILGGCLFGIVILAIHFVIVVALMRFYRMSKQLSAALSEADASRAELKHAYEKLSETAVFEERNRIAKDIHDNAGHSITSVIMQTEAAKLLIDTDPAEAKTRIISANIQAKNALDQMRSSVHLLAGRPAERSVKDGIEDIVAQTVDSTDLKIRCDLEDITLDEERARFLFNSVKECITNGIRHGGATAFYIEAKMLKDEVSLLVSDNGSGLSEDFSEGYGLKSMREKAEEFGGGIRISGEPGEGCEVEVFIKSSPVKAA
ncbi:MAG TPA: sensor histidine kinase [Candidatus Coproplasma excrementavium]|nr:sensor histidine kinase [Candidatus Coproplasma excrementavium]